MKDTQSKTLAVVEVVVVFIVTLVIVGVFLASVAAFSRSASGSCTSR